MAADDLEPFRGQAAQLTLLLPHGSGSWRESEDRDGFVNAGRSL